VRLHGETVVVATTELEIFRRETAGGQIAIEGAVHV
jgi:hypothetical protein